MKSILFGAAALVAAPTLAFATPITAFSLFGGASTVLNSNVIVNGGLIGSNGGMNIGGGSNTLTITGAGALVGNSNVLANGNIVFNGNVTIGGGTHITGDIDSSGNVVLNSNVVVDGNIRAAGTVTLGGSATVNGDVDAGALAGTAVTLNSNADILGTTTHRAGTTVNCGGTTIPPGAACGGGATIGPNVFGTPDAPAAYATTTLLSPTAYAAGFTDISNAGGVTTSLLANTSWDDVVTGSNNTINLVAGTYTFDSWNIGGGTVLNLDLTGGAINLLFTGNVVINSNLVVNLIGGNATDVYTETKGNFSLGGGSQWYGTLFGSGVNSDITFNSNTTLTGSAVATRNLSIGGGSTINFVSSDVSATELNSVAAVPEPASLVLLGSGLLAVAARVRSRRKR